MANVAMVGVLPSPTYQHRQQQAPTSSTPSSSMQPQQHRPQQQQQQQQRQQQQQQHHEEHPRILPPPSYRHKQPPPQSASTSSQHIQIQHHRQATQNSLTVSSRNNAIGSIPQTAASENTAISSTVPPPSSGAGGELSPHQSLDLSYMHRPPTILPNYGKRSRGSVLPKSNVSRVLLYDNITQQTMLDVRVNNIRSQSYKINRELDMHMKSFISRRKVREKALKKITRVQHMDDYEEFSQEHQEPGSANFLPAVGPHKSSKKITDNKRGLGKPHGTNANVKTPTLKTFEDNNTLPRITISSQSDFKTQSGTGTPKSNRKQKSDNLSLPKIGVSSVTHKDDEENDDNNYDATDTSHDRRYKVGVNFVESDQGVTRVFNIVTEDTDIIPTSEKSLRDGSSTPNKPTVTFSEPSDFPEKPDENNNTPSTPDNYTQTTKDAIAVHLQPRKSIFQIQKEKAQEEELLRLANKERTRSSLSDIPSDLHPEKPTIDSRYLHLQRLLVPQNPPNEGFAELSPSFPKRYPSLKDLSPRSRRKEYAKQRKRDGKPNDDCDGEYSGGDGDFLTDSSDEEQE